MTTLHDLLKLHKKTVFFNDKIIVNCILKPPSSSDEYPVKGLTSFIGLTVTESGMGVFADSFEITFNIDEISEYTSKTPARGWGVSVELPQLNYKMYSFFIENAAVDRTLGMYLVKCSASSKNSGGI